MFTVERRSSSLVAVAFETLEQREACSRSVLNFPGFPTTGSTGPSADRDSCHAKGYRASKRRGAGSELAVGERLELRRAGSRQEPEAV